MEPSAKDLRKMALKVIDADEATVITSGTPVSPVSNTDAVAVRVINNTSTLVFVGMDAAHVDGSSTPPKGFPLDQYDSRAFFVKDDASEVQIDAAGNNIQVSLEIYGR